MNATRNTAITAEEAASCLQDVIRRGEKLLIRSGGHDVNGYSAADDAVIIDLRYLDSVDISDDIPKSRLALQ
ncbi:FAD linked oxidase N-terminal [Penicillium soppii]|uniref:FAD linked oxidase N-terminal n=1 Tax=Penicillium soppii TaxID=69789 RepID=UPI0025487AF4|nr:FAD linked oxidase N-terminal [Penicillium soppii]KAJ5874358.1 FAD linked oxidase N-terminal [Penicillium soppii]